MILEKVSNESNIPLDIVLDDQKSNKISLLAKEYFSTNYNQLLTLKDQIAGKMAGLENQKDHLERTWTYCCYGEGRGLDISIMESLAIVISSIVALILGFHYNNNAVASVGLFGLFIFWSPLVCNCCIKESDYAQLTLEEHQLVKQNISTIQEKKLLVKALIKSTKLFAQCCKNWNVLKASFNENHVKAVFAALKEMNQKDAAKEVVGEAFLSVAPLFVMEKIFQLFDKSQIAQQWQALKNNPVRWAEKDMHLWNRVEFPSPTNVSTYVSFLQYLKDNAPQADPSQWQNWFDNILKTKIEELKQATEL